MGEAKARKAAADRARLERKLPDNLSLLHDGETNYRQASVDAIEGNPELMDHVHMVEVVMNYIHYFSQLPPRDPDHHTIQLLGRRVFNDLASAHGLMLRGYYQTAAALLRDIIETGDIILYFKTRPKEISVWMASDRATRLKQFAPKHIRKHLNSFPGFSEDKRGQRYRMFCEYAAHPTPEGFPLMGPKGGEPMIGPFFDTEWLKMIVEEMAQLGTMAGLRAGNWFTSDRDVEAFAQKLRFIEAAGIWMERYLGKKMDKRGIDQMKLMLQQLRSGIPQ